MPSETLREQIAQMIVVRASGHFFDSQIRYPQWEATNAQLQYWLEELNVGGVILLGGTAAEVCLRTAQLQEWAKTPLLIAADIEEGVGQRFPGATVFPPPMALDAIANTTQADELARQMGQVTAEEAAALGINWVLAPVVDVNNNPQNPVINVRAFSQTPDQVSQLATAFIEGAKAAPVLTTAKHFPGHGDTATDSHLSLPVVEHSEERLQQVELPPFKAAIAAGVDTVMSAHLLLPAWDENAPATLSHRALTQTLRQDLGFEGLVVTDALVMAGVAKWASPAEVCVQAIVAGADILLMPLDPVMAIDAVEQAVATGRLSADRIAASVTRIRAAKQKVNASSVDSPLLQLSHVSSTAAQQSVLDILNASNTVSPVTPPPPSTDSDTEHWNVLVVPDVLTYQDYVGYHTPAIVRPAAVGYTGPHVMSYHQFETAAIAPGQHLLQLFVRGNPFRGQASLSSVLQQQIQDLLEQHLLGAIVLYGSPYVRDWLAQACPARFPCFFSYGQMPSAQTLMLDAVLASNDDDKQMSRGFI